MKTYEENSNVELVWKLNRGINKLQGHMEAFSDLAK